MPKEVEELVFVWASRLSPYPWVRFDYPFPFVIRSKNRGELQCLLKQVSPDKGCIIDALSIWGGKITRYCRINMPRGGRLAEGERLQFNLTGQRPS
ncbi:hypothetical protein TNCV_3751151 [Trichonephila clavipes]|uniref:Uncharacterized protein n=1 Tax=Trichonephila clavipes TaxID=2585209 RepID=A0A8X6R6Q2_TRICX|nr:hypothetical protein TNCV_3751151 [Trichonephila clavipes]